MELGTLQTEAFKKISIKIPLPRLIISAEFCILTLSLFSFHLMHDFRNCHTCANLSHGMQNTAVIHMLFTVPDLLLS